MRRIQPGEEKADLPGPGEYNLEIDSIDARSLRASRRGKGLCDYTSLRHKVEMNTDFPGPG